MKIVIVAMGMWLVACDEIIDFPTMEEAVADIKQQMNDAAGCDFTAKYEVKRALFERTEDGRKQVGETIAYENDVVNASISILPIASGDKMLFDVEGLPVAIPLPMWKNVLVHEIGHAAGLEHVRDPFNIMSTGGVHDGIALDVAIYQVVTAAHPCD